MSIKGNPQQWFADAVRNRSLPMALTELPDLHRPLSLEFALGLTVLYGENQHPRFGRAAARWVARFILERETVELEDLGPVVAALRLLPDDGLSARAALAELVGEHGLDGAARMLTG